MSIPCSQVSATSNSQATEYPAQRQSFIAQGRFWVFYHAATLALFYRSRVIDPLGAWSAATTVDTTSHRGQHTSLWFDGTYVHWTHGSYGLPDSLYYCRGTPAANGTISWGTLRIAVAAVSGSMHEFNGVCVDSHGYPVIGWAQSFGGAGGAYDTLKIKWATATDGSAWGTETTLDSNTDVNVCGLPILLPLPNRKILVIWTNQGIPAIRSRLWNGNSWEATQNIVSVNTNLHCAVGLGPYALLTVPVSGTIQSYRWTQASDSWERLADVCVASVAPLTKVKDSNTQAFAFPYTASGLSIAKYHSGEWSPAISLCATATPISARTVMADYETPTGLSYEDYYMNVIWTQSGYSVWHLGAAYLLECPEVITLPASKITETSARLNGRVIYDGGGLCSYNFGYRLAFSGDEYTYVGWSWPLGGDRLTGDYFNASISGLTANTAYEYIAGVKNASCTTWGLPRYFMEGGPGDDGDEETCYTIPDLYDHKGRVAKGSRVRAYRCDTDELVSESTIDQYGTATLCGLPIGVDIRFIVNWGGVAQDHKSRTFFRTAAQILEGGTGATTDATISDTLAIGATVSIWNLILGD